MIRTKKTGKPVYLCDYIVSIPSSRGNDSDSAIVPPKPSGEKSQSPQVGAMIRTDGRNQLSLVFVVSQSPQVGAMIRTGKPIEAPADNPLSQSPQVGAMIRTQILLCSHANSMLSLNPLKSGQ